MRKVKDKKIEAGKKIFKLWRFFYGEPKTHYQTKWWKTKPKEQDW